MSDFIRAVKNYIHEHESFVHAVNEKLESILYGSQTAAPSEKQKTKTTSASIQLKTSENKRVLVVDDAEINRVLMGHFFKHLPVKLDFAVSGEQAVQKTLESFDLILMDLQMKGMSGVDAIKSIREKNQKIKILAISNLEPSDDERKQALAVGANEYLSRAMNRDDLRAKVCEILFGVSA